MDGVLKVLEHRVPPADLEAALVELRQVALLAGPTEEGSE